DIALASCAHGSGDSTHGALTYHALRLRIEFRPAAPKGASDFAELTVSLKRLRKKSRCGPQRPSAAKAGIDFVILAARLKPRPFKTKSKPRVFSRPIKPCLTQSPPGRN